MEKDPLINLKGMSPEEYSFIQQVITGMDEQQKRNFYMIYYGKRKDPQEILLFTLLGFLGVAGIQRFIIGQMGMGILYFFTAGLCFIGTIMDVINHRSLTFEFNQKAATESAQLVRLMPPSQSLNV